MTKYLVVGGYARSQHDGDIHFISPVALCRLYGVDTKECLLIWNIDTLLGMDLSKYIILRPRSDGKYETV